MRSIFCFFIANIGVFPFLISCSVLHYSKWDSIQAVSAGAFPVWLINDNPTACYFGFLFEACAQNRAGLGDSEFLV